MEKELKEAVMEQQIREKEFEDLKASLEADLGAYMQEADELGARRSEMVYNLDPEALKTYERVRTALDGDAIVHVENRICGGCYMSITSNDYVRICGMKEIVTCKSCQRILFIPEYLEKQE
jgi:predicted  nucleic acid-binding Zn-ribbon protein